ncbi:glycosyltransferase family 4 protein [uncultured Vibrio sp.]|uniref:glycosyltransferase family 4 protein n=1 Tax=uncultured Vibrio sp. TaxID=114054 RepID=UPI0026153315|nr:glycosyltransferase family 4 protein [uncultured Vibrio sp.]
MKKRILVVTSSYPYGKGEGFIEPELKHLSDDFIVDLLPTYPRGDIKKEYVDISGDYIQFNLFEFFYIRNFILYMISRPLSLFKFIGLCFTKNLMHTLRNLTLLPKAIYFSETNLLSKKYDFIYCHWLTAPAQLGLLLSEMTGTPFGVTAHRWDIIDANNFRKKMNKISFVRTISEHSNDLFPQYIIDSFSNKIQRIYLGVAVDEANSTRKLASDKIEFKFVCIGSLISVKGHVYLLEAIQHVFRKFGPVKCTFIGDGKLLDELKAYSIKLGIEDSVVFEGNIEHSVVLDLLNSEQFDFCCLPSIDLGAGLHEGIPVALMEAMNAGLPCISTNTGSINELINDGVNGLLVEDKNSIALGDSIIRLLSDEVLYSDLSKSGLQSVSKNFNSRKNNKILCDMIRKFSL